MGSVVKDSGDSIMQYILYGIDWAQGRFLQTQRYTAAQSFLQIRVS